MSLFYNLFATTPVKEEPPLSVKEEEEVETPSPSPPVKESPPSPPPVIKTYADAAIGTTSSDFVTDFTTACVNGSMNVMLIRTLFGNNTDTENIKILSSVNPHGYSLIHLACVYGHSDIVEYIICKYPSEALRKNIINGATPAHYAAMFGYVNILEILKNSITFEETDTKGNTVIFGAGKFSNTSNVSKVITYLLNNKVNSNALNNKGKNSLHKAVKFNDYSIVSMLCCYGTNPNITDRFGRTPLHFAAKNGYVDVIRCLIEHGAVISKKDNIGCLAYDYAADPYAKNLLKVDDSNKCLIKEKIH